MSRATLCLWSVFLAGLVILLYAIFRPTQPPQLFQHSDKVGHLLAFFGVALSGRFALARLSDWVYWPIWGLAAFALEYLQGAWLPLRQADWEDTFANLSGVLLALLCGVALNALRRRNLLRPAG